MPPPRLFLPAANTEFTERTIHNCRATGETVGILRRKTVGVPKRETADIPKREMVGAPRRETVGTPRRMMVRAEKTWRRFDSQD
jgi:hypothetical protein